MSLNFTGEFCVKAMTNHGKLKEKLTCQFKIDLRNLTKFGTSTQKSHLMGFFGTKYIMFELKKV